MNQNETFYFFTGLIAGVLVMLFVTLGLSLIEG